jgi:serine/threonine protein kinase
MTTPPDPHQPGRLVGSRYKLLNIVGQGGMGVVLKAEDTKLRREVLVPALARDPRFGAILERLRLNANSC